MSVYQELDQDVLHAFKVRNENAQTRKSTATWVAKWEKYKVDAGIESTADFDLSDADLCRHLQSLFIQLKKTDGSDYLATSVKIGLGGLARHFAKPENGARDLWNNKPFKDDLIPTIDRKMKDRQQAGKIGNNSAPMIEPQQLQAMLDSPACDRRAPYGLLRRIYLLVATHCFERGGGPYDLLLEWFSEHQDEQGKKMRRVSLRR
jgi:hypothetical protein